MNKNDPVYPTIKFQKHSVEFVFSCPHLNCESWLLEQKLLGYSNTYSISVYTLSSNHPQCNYRSTTVRGRYSVAPLLHATTVSSFFFPNHLTCSENYDWRKLCFENTLNNKMKVSVYNSWFLQQNHNNPKTVDWKLLFLSSLVESMEIKQSLRISRTRLRVHNTSVVIKPWSCKHGTKERCELRQTKSRNWVAVNLQ